MSNTYYKRSNWTIFKKAVKKIRTIGWKVILKIVRWTTCDKVLISKLNLIELLAPIKPKITPNTIKTIRIFYVKSVVD